MCGLSMEKKPVGLAYLRDTHTLRSSKFTVISIGEKKLHDIPVITIRNMLGANDSGRFGKRETQRGDGMSLWPKNRSGSCPTTVSRRPISGQPGRAAAILCTAVVDIVKGTWTRLQGAGNHEGSDPDFRASNDGACKHTAVQTCPANAY